MLRSLPLSRSLLHQPVFPEPALPGALPPSPKLTLLIFRRRLSLGANGPTCSCVSCVFLVLSLVQDHSNVLDSDLDWVRPGLTIGVFHPGSEETAASQREGGNVLRSSRTSCSPPARSHSTEHGPVTGELTSSLTLLLCHCSRRAPSLKIQKPSL